MADKRRKRIAAAVLLPLCLVAVVLTAVLTLQSGMTASGDAWDLNYNNFVTGVVVKDSGGTVIPPGGLVTQGDSYQFNVSFKENPSKQFAYNGQGKLVYQLPPSIKVVSAVNNAPIMGSGTPAQPIGTYSITTGGLVTIQFNNVNADGSATPGTGNFIDRYTNAEFKLDILAEFTGSIGSVNLNFGNNLTINMDVKQPSADPTIEKIAADFDYTMHSVNYTVKVTAKGTAMTISRFSDLAYEVLGAQYNIKQSDITITNLKVDGVAATPIWTTRGGRALWDINFSPAKTLAVGQSMVVTYTVDFTPLFVSRLGANFMYQNYAAYGTNTASVSYTTPTNSTPTEISDDAEVRVVHRMIYKDGRSTPGGNIFWSGFVGDGIHPLSGKTITDTFLGGFGQPTFVGVTLYDKDEHELGYLQIPYSAGGFSYTVPSTYSGKVVYGVQFDYEVPVDHSTAVDGMAKNKVGIDFPGGPSFTAEVPVGIPGLMIEKYPGWVDEENILWTVIIKVPAGMQGQHFLLGDFMNGQDGLTGQEPLFHNPAPSDLTVKVNGVVVPKGQAPLKWNIWNWSPNQWVLTLNNTNEHTADLSSWPYNTATELVLTYTTPLSTKLIDSDMTLGEYLKEHTGRIAANGATLQMDYKIVGSAYTQTRWPVFKQMDTPKLIGNDLFIDYSVLLTGANSPSFSPEYFGNGEAIFTDEFDAWMEFVPGSFYVEMRQYAWPGVEGQIASSIVDATFKYPNNGNPSVVNNKMTVDLEDLRHSVTTGSPAGVYEANWYVNQDYFMIARYQLKLPNAKNLPDQVVLRNTASIDANGSKTNQPANGHFSDSAETTYGTKAVTKEMTRDGHTASFDIIVNPKGLQLDSGSPLHITDTMNNTMAFYLTTLKAYTESVKGSGNFNVPVTLTQTDEVSPTTELWKWALTNENEVTIVIPDSTPVKISYETLIKGTNGEEVTVENYVSVSGKYYTEVEEKFVLQESTGSGGGSTGKFLLLKNDEEEPAKFLPDAKFALYIGWNDDEWDFGGNTAPTPPDGIADTFTSGAYTYYYLDDATTDAGGSILFANSWLTPESVASGANFLVREIAAPPGYQMPSNADTLVDLYTDTGTDYVTIGNTSKKIPVTLNGTKAVDGAVPTGQMPDFGFRLTQVTDATGATQTDPLNQKTTSRNGAGTFSFTTGALSPGSCYFLVDEVPGTPNPAWIYDAAQYLAAVTVTADTHGNLSSAVAYKVRANAMAQWETWSGSTADFTNRCDSLDASVVLKALKNTEGAPMTAEQFSFALYEKQGSTFSETPMTAQNGAPDGSGKKGEIVFDPLIFSAAGDYYYLLKETGEATGWSMDTACWLIKITVAADASDGNKLKGTISYLEANADGTPKQLPEQWSVYNEGNLQARPSFTNTYGGPKFPDTGGAGRENFRNAAIALSLLATLFLAGTFTYTYRKRRRCLAK